jgi:hypothetical protein
VIEGRQGSSCRFFVSTDYLSRIERPTLVRCSTGSAVGTVRESIAQAFYCRKGQRLIRSVIVILHSFPRAVPCHISGSRMSLRYPRLHNNFSLIGLH